MVHEGCYVYYDFLDSESTANVDRHCEQLNLFKDTNTYVYVQFLE